MKRILSLVVCLAFVSAISFGEVNSTVTCKLFNEYLGANGGVFYDKPVVQCDVFVSTESGFYGDLWVSKPEGSWMANFGSEVDITPIGKMGRIGSLGYDIAIAYYAIWDAGTDLADVLNPYAEINGKLGHELGTWYLKYEYYMPVSGDAPRRGNMLRLGVRNSNPLGRGALSLKGEVFYDSGAFGSDEAILADMQASVLWPFAGMKVGPVVKYYTPLTSVSKADGRHGEVAFGIIVQK